MRILTVRQPWAWAIIHGGKDVENRTRNLAGEHRGPVAIHAATTLDSADDSRIGAAIRNLYVEPRRDVEEVPSVAGGDDPWFVTSPWFGHRGGIIGVVDLVNVHGAECPGRAGVEDIGADLVRGYYAATCSPWAERDSWHLVLANPRPLPEPIPYRGALGLRELPPEVEAQIWEALT